MIKSCFTRFVFVACFLISPIVKSGEKNKHVVYEKVFLKLDCTSCLCCLALLGESKGSQWRSKKVFFLRQELPLVLARLDQKSAASYWQYPGHRVDWVQGTLSALASFEKDLVGLDPLRLVENYGDILDYLILHGVKNPESLLEHVFPTIAAHRRDEILQGFVSEMSPRAFDSEIHVKYVVPKVSGLAFGKLEKMWTKKNLGVSIYLTSSEAPVFPTMEGF